MRFNILLLLLVLSVPIMADTLTKEDNDTISVSENVYKKNNIYFQVMGSSMFYSLSYDRMIFKKGIHNFSAGLGFEYLDLFMLTYNINLIPQINYYIGDKKHYLLLGFATIFDFADLPTQKQDLVSIIMVSYRFQKPEGGLFFQGGINYKSGLVDDFFHGSFWPGLALGYTF
jgi:hypothetical protein